MSDRMIQEQFGQIFVDGLRAFARKDIASVDETMKDLDHIIDIEFRRVLAECVYGARWMYKLGLAALAEPQERAAHIRTQVIDYAAATEGLLGEAISWGIANGHLTGQMWQFADYKRLQRKIAWSAKPRDDFVKNRISFAWLIAVASEEKLLSGALTRELTDSQETPERSAPLRVVQVQARHGQERTRALRADEPCGAKVEGTPQVAAR